MTKKSEEEIKLTQKLVSSLISSAKEEKYECISNHLEIYTNDILDLRQIPQEDRLQTNERTKKMVESMPNKDDPTQCKSFLTFFFRTILDISEILPGIYVSGLEGGMNEEVLQFLGISHVVRVLDGKYFANRARYNAITSTDIDAPDRNPKFIEKILLKGVLSVYKNHIEGKHILIHCRMGISRSVSVTIGFIMLVKEIDYDQALLLVKSKRSIAQPYRGFSEYLKFSLV